MAALSLFSFFSLLILWSHGGIVKVPPITIYCSQPHGEVLSLQNTTENVICLSAEEIKLFYNATTSVSVTETDKPPECSWYSNGAWFITTSLWSGSVMIHGIAGTIITVQCVTSQCPINACQHQNSTITISDQHVHLFILSPAPPISQYQLVRFGWCAKLKSTAWEYHFSRHQGVSSTVISSDGNMDIEASEYPSDFRDKCAGYYNYQANASYAEAGNFVASLSSQTVPMNTLTVSLLVEQGLDHVLSATAVLNQNSHLRLTWALVPLSNKAVAFQLTDENSVASWNLFINKHAIKINLCSPLTSSSGNDFATVVFLTNNSRISQIIGDIGYHKGTIMLSTSRYLGSVTLDPTLKQVTSYYFNQASGLYYSSIENETAASFSENYVFCEHESLSFLFKFKYDKPSLLSIATYMYLNKNQALYKSLLDDGIEVQLFTSSPAAPNSFTYIVWFIPNQHPSIQCQWTFNLEIFGARKSYLVQLSKYTYNDSVANAQTFLPGTVLPFDVNKYTGFVAKANFTQSGEKPVILNVNLAMQVIKVLETSINIPKFPCELLAFNINKPKATDSIITTTGRQLTLYLSMTLNCVASHSTNITWKIYRLSSKNSIPDWNNYLNLPGISPMNQTTLVIPKNSLNVGFYLFHVSIDVPRDDDDRENMRSNSDTVTVEVQESELIAVISGGSFRTVGFNSPWILNGNSSSDPDLPDELKGLSFTWHCTRNIDDYNTMKLSSDSSCHPAQQNLTWINPNDVTQTVAAEQLQGGRNYHFRLLVEKDKRTSNFTQTVFVQRGSPPLVTLECIENCFTKFIPTERFSLSGKCTDCSTSSRPEYQWSLLRGTTEEDFDWASKTTTGRSTPYMSIMPLTFINAVDRRYTLVLTVTTWSGAQSTSKYSFYVNAPPEAGTCFIKPPRGVALETQFIIGCSRFKDQNQPLTYKVLAAIDKNSNISSLRDNPLGVIVYHGYEPTTPPILLPVGDQSQDYNLKLYVQVYDALSAYTEISLSAIVTEYQVGKPQETVLKNLNAMVNGSSSVMNTLLGAGDFINSGHLIYMITSNLNNFKATEATYPLKEERTQLREHLLNVSSSLAVTDIMGVNQVVTCIVELTKDVKEVNLQSQQLAVRKLSEVASSLATHRQESLGSAEKERLSSGIVTSLSSVMSAALLDIPPSESDIREEKVEVLEQIVSAMETLTEAVLQGKVPGENKTTIKAATFNISLKKEEKWDLANSHLQMRDDSCLSCSSAKLQVSLSDVPVDAVVSTAFYEFEESPFPWLRNGREIHTDVAGYYILASNSTGGTTNLMPEMVEVVLDRKNNTPVFDLAFEVGNITRAAFSFQLNVTVKAEWFIQFIYPGQMAYAISLYIGNNITNNTPIEVFNIPKTINPGSNTAWNPKMISIPMELLPKTEPIIDLSVEVTPSSTYTQVQYSIFNVACLDFSGAEDEWNEGNCHAGPLTDNAVIHCICENLTKVQMKGEQFLQNKHTFLAARAFVLPNPIDLTKVTVETLRGNLVPLITVIVIIVFYAIISVLAHIKDKRDVTDRKNVIILQDNDPYETESLLVTFYTGSRFRSGTRASVYMKIFGKNGDSHAHHLQCHGQKVLQTGGCDTFLVKTKQPLGDIQSIEVWHKPNMKSPSWYLSRIQIEDLHTKKKWYFMCRTWFGTNKKGAVPQKMFAPIDIQQPLEKKDFFLINAYYNLFLGNLLLSVFAPDVPTISSRAQRLASQFVSFMGGLFCSMMYYNRQNDEEEMKVELLLRSICVGAVTSLITKVFRLVVDKLFAIAQNGSLANQQQLTENDSQNELLDRSSEPRCLECLYEEYSSTDSSENISVRSASNAQDMQDRRSIPRCLECLYEEYSSTDSSENKSVRSASNAQDTQDGEVKITIENENLGEIPKGKVRRVRNVQLCAAWGMVVFFSTLSAVLIVLYGLSYGYEISMEWLIASWTSFLMGVFVQHGPITLLLSFIYSIRAKYYRDIPWVIRNYVPVKDDVKSEEEMRNLQFRIETLRSSGAYQPITPTELQVITKAQNCNV
uniref:Polycystic kidney disease and receptor for egg jelly-related protein n=1 Tax=Xenopus tropicalis TaxID=8364 RepID=A0A6I8Q711_XENTR